MKTTLPIVFLLFTISAWSVFFLMSSGSGLLAEVILHLVATIGSIVMLARKAKGMGQALSILALTVSALGVLVSIPAILAAIAFSDGVPIH